MSPEEKKYIKNEINKIDEEYILQEFNLDVERQNILSYKNHIDIIEKFYFKYGNNGTSMEEFFMFIERLYIAQDDTLSVNEVKRIVKRIVSNYDSHNGGYDLTLNIMEAIPETDDEVIRRLIRKEQIEITKALTTKFNAPGIKKRLEAQRKTLAEKKRKQEQAEIEAAKKLLNRKGFIVEDVSNIKEGEVVLYTK